METIQQLFVNLIYHNILFQKVVPFFFNFKINIPVKNIPLLSSVSPYFPFVVSLILLIIVLYLLHLTLRLRKALKEQPVLLELTPPAFTEKTAYTTQELFKIFHNLGKHRSFVDMLLGKKTIFSFEIVSSQNQGIRYVVRVAPNQVSNIKRNLLSYLPQIRVTTVDEYLPANLEKLGSYHSKIIEFKLSHRFAFPLKRQDTLKEHDPVAYITGGMTKLAAGELASLQFVVSPIHLREVSKMRNMILRNEDVYEYLRKPKFPWYFQIVFEVIKLGGRLLYSVLSGITEVISEFQHGATVVRSYPATHQPPIQRALNTLQLQENKTIQGKIEQPLFETSIRLLVVAQTKQELRERINNFISSLSIFSEPGYQALVLKKSLPLTWLTKFRLFSFKKRLLSAIHNSSSTILSISEVADLYHFPFTSVTQTEDLVKTHSKELPAPLSLKRADSLDITFAKNFYGGSTTMIGLSREERRRHMYIIGATGTGKSTLLLSMINQDIRNGKGLAVLDPHGDLIEKILPTIPDERMKDVIYFNPDDVGYPIGINLLELSQGLSDDDSLREREFISESIISLFHKLYTEKYSGPRMEYILRNTIHTAFTVPGATLFTVYKLLINTPFRKQVTANLTDENLKDFWKYEFSKAGDYQKVKMISPITNKIGRFLFSPVVKRILEQEKSSVNFDEIMDSGKILLCNLSKGKIGEDTSNVFGVLLMTKIQLAALKRAKTDSENRRDFYLYVDEFQNFATPSFAQILSEARKYRLNAILAHQTTSQLEDKSLVQVTLANTGTIICFRTANPEDEKLLLPQFYPYIQQGEIANLPAFHFYMKNNALNPEEPFSGETIPLQIIENGKKVDEVVKISREQYAKAYTAPMKSDQKIMNKPKKENVEDVITTIESSQTIGMLT